MDTKRHLIVISEDALVYEDLETLKTLPAFGSIWDRTARVEKVRSIYPTITYPCHTTMMTGVYPERHGILNNEQNIMCERSSKWIHFKESVKAPTIFDLAKSNGFSTGAVFWPVSGHHPNSPKENPIDYLVAEYWPQSEDETHYDCFVNSGSTPEVMDKAVAHNLSYVTRYARNHPYVDHFIHACACDIIREFKPNLLMVHPANIDAYRHQTGIFSPKVTHALHEIDLWFGTIIKACEDAGIYDDTDFIITSDHGQMNIVRTVAPNVLFAENGLIDVDSEGNITGYQAFCKSTALSAQVYLKDPGDKAVYDKTYALLRRMCEEGVYGISQVFTAEEVQAKEHLAGDFSFVLETDGYSSFSNEWLAPYVRPLNNADYRFGRATHGYLPEKGPQPTMFAFGPHIRPGVVVEHGRLVDQAPTFARLLGLEMKGVDGKPIEEILCLEAIKNQI